MEHTTEFFTRNQLAKRWKCSVRKIDRLRTYGLIAWIDLSGGKGTRPTVRFRMETILAFETKNLMSISMPSTSKMEVANGR
jgi:hypothetical protein